MSYKTDDMSSLFKIVGCSEDTYKKQNNSVDPAYEYTMYLVNHGTAIEGQAYTDLYYGPRKLTDVLIVKEPPLNTSYPNDKIYLLPRMSEGLVVGYQVYFKHADIVTPIETSAVAGVNYEFDEENNQVTQVIVNWNTSDNEFISTRLLVLTSEGLPPEEFINNVTQRVRESLADELSVKWEPIKT